MKWVDIFRRKRCKEETNSSEDELGDLRCHDPHLRAKRRSVSFEYDRESYNNHHHERRTSLEQWQDVRHARNSVDGQASTPRTTETLTVSKAGDTTILNNTYIMIKHLGSGTFGKVKLCFNIVDQKLYAVKSCRKSQLLRQLDHGLRRRACHSSPPPSPAMMSVGTATPPCIGGGAGHHRRGFAGAKSVSLQEAKSRLGAQGKAEDVVREIAILKKLKHPNIVSLVEVIDDPRTDSLLLVMEYVEGSTLETKQVGLQAWEPMAEQDVWWCAREVLQGLEYLHFHSVVHADLKPANLLRDSNNSRIKITDFSSSAIAASDAFPGGASFSTPAFRPPESLAAGYRSSFQMDMWALGVCLYQWAYGELPFSGTDPFTVYTKIRSLPLSFPSTRHVSTHLQDIILRLLDKNPATRLDVSAAMSHPWVTQGGGVPLVGLAGQRGGGGRRAGGAEGGPMDVTQEEIDAAIREGDLAAHLLDDVFHQHSYQKSDHLARCGEAADKIFLIAQGEVEIYRTATSPNAPTTPIISGLPDSLAEEEPVSDFVDLPCGGRLSMDADLPPTVAPPAPVTATTPLLKQTKVDILGRRPQTVEGFRLLAVRGPGESLGLGPLRRDPLHPHVWQASVRAKDEVVAFVAEVEDVLLLLKQHPEMERLVQQICAQQQTDMMVADAMRQLRLTYPPSCLPACPPVRQCPACELPLAGGIPQCLQPSL